MDNTDLVQQSDLYEVRDTANKGKGLFAIKNIPIGTLLIEESPLLAVPVLPTMSRLILRSFVYMPLQKKYAWLSLSGREDKTQESMGGCNESGTGHDHGTGHNHGTGHIHEVSTAGDSPSTSNRVDEEGTQKPQDAPSSELHAENSRNENGNETGLSIKQGQGNGVEGLSIRGADEPFHRKHDDDTSRPVYHYKDFKSSYQEAVARRRGGEVSREATTGEEHASNETTTSEDNTSNKIPSEEVVKETTTSKDNAGDETSGEEVSSEEVARETATGEDDASNKTTGENAPNQQVAKETTTSKDDAGNETPSENIPNQETTEEEEEEEEDTSQYPIFPPSTKVLEIFEINALGFKVDNRPVVALCVNAARLNHSCVPNVFRAYDIKSRQHTVHAMRDIAVGEELSTSYIAGTYLTSVERKAELEKWGFECTCPACSGELEGSDERRSRLSTLSEEADVARVELRSDRLSPAAAFPAMRVVTQMVDLLREEGLHLGGEMADLCGTMAMLDLQAGLSDSALRWMWQKAILLGRCHGLRSRVFWQAVDAFEISYNRLCGVDS